MDFLQLLMHKLDKINDEVYIGIYMCVCVYIYMCVCVCVCVCITESLCGTAEINTCKSTIFQ